MIHSSLPTIFGASAECDEPSALSALETGDNPESLRCNLKSYVHAIYGIQITGIVIKLMEDLQYSGPLVEIIAQRLGPDY
jgi:hypothetical protein